MRFMAWQAKLTCGRTFEELARYRGQLVVTLAEQLAMHADTAASHTTLPITMEALQLLDPIPVYRVEVRSTAVS